MGLTGRYLTVKVLSDCKDPIGTRFKEEGILAKGKEKERIRRLGRNVGGNMIIFWWLVSATIRRCAPHPLFDCIN